MTFCFSMIAVRIRGTEDAAYMFLTALRGLLLGTPSNLAVDFGVLLVAAVLSIVAASSLLGRLAR